MPSVMAIVLSRVEPPAPEVTETKVGLSASMRRSAIQSFCSPSAVLGGKNSNEKDRSPLASRSRSATADGTMPSRLSVFVGSERIRRGQDGEGLRVPVPSFGVIPDSPLDAEDLRTRVQKALDDVLAHQAEVLDAVSPDLAPLMDSVSNLLSGGKRLRAAFCYWGWRGAGGPEDAGALSVAASLEVFQAAALIHDDVMDGSDTRRGMPAVHRRFASLHRGNGWL